MSSFLVSKEDVKNFFNVPRLNMQQGICFAYSAPPEIIKKLVPPPLEAVAPVIIGYIQHFGGTSFGGPYLESVISTPCKYKNDVGRYAYGLLLHGHGTEGGTILGSNCCGIPKKRADFMELNRIGDLVTAKVVRHGVTLLECNIKLGEYNVQEASDFLRTPVPGSVNEGINFYHKFNMTQTGNGNCIFSDVNLVKLVSKSKSLSWEPGFLDIKVNSSPDDPYGEFEVVKPLGAAFFENEYIEMSKLIKLAELDTEETMPYLMTGRYDRSMMGKKSTYLKSYYHD